jgi:uncharacterized repeat protein (TIGR01451 family)
MMKKQKQIKRSGILLFIVLAFALCVCGSVTAHDSNYPAVTITNPQHNTQVNGTVHINATAESHSEITQVVFNVSDGHVATDNNPNDGWSYDWDTSNTPNGQYSVKATALNLDGLTGSYTILLNVNNSQQSTQLTLNDVQGIPNQNANLNALLKDASNNPISGKVVQFSVNGTVVGNRTTDNSGVATYAYTPTATGLYNVQALFNGDLRYAASQDNATILSIPNNPFLEYSTYFGGSEWEKGKGIFVDEQGNIYISGVTKSANTSPNDFPAPAGGVIRIGPSGNYDVFVVKMSSNGTILYSTILGGTARDTGNSLAVDALGNAYVTGFTQSADYPTTEGAYDRTYGSVTDAFVFKLNSTGNLAYSTYLGGTILTRGWGIAVDNAGCAYITGITNSPDFPTTEGAFQTTKGGPVWHSGDPSDQVYQDSFDAFVAKLNPTGTALIYSTYLGGSQAEQPLDIAIDNAGCAYIVGEETCSMDFPVKNAFQNTFGGGSQDSFVTKLNPNGTALIYSTYLGGLGADQGVKLTVDAAGNVYITGETYSSNFPTTEGAYQRTYKGPDENNGDAFITKLDTNGALIFSTLLGGNGDDAGTGIAVNSDGTIYVAGQTASTDFPTTLNAYQTTNAGNYDAFVSRLSPDGKVLSYSTYLGGNTIVAGTATSTDQANNLVLGQGGFYVYGFTNSADFPTTTDAFQKNNGYKGTGTGVWDMFITKFVNPTQITTGNVTGEKGATVNLTATLSEANTLGYAPLANKTVRFMVNGVFAGNATTNGSGVATLAYLVGLVGGNYTVQAFFDGDVDHLASSSSGTLKVPQSSLYVRTSSNKANPAVGDTVIITYKLSNDGPDPASNVVMRFTVPEGLEYLGSSKDIGTLEYDPVTRTVTWTVDSMPVGDPYFSVEMLVQKAAVFGLQPVIASGTYDPTIGSSVLYRTLTTREKAVDTSGNSNTSVNAATATGTSSGVGVNSASSTVPMQTTGVPLVGMVLAVLMLAGGIVTSKK